MSILLQQTAEQASRSLSLSTRAELLSIYAAKFQAMRANLAEIQSSQDNLKVKLATKFRPINTEIRSDRVFVSVLFSLSAKRDSESEPETLLKFQCVFDAEYKIPDDYTPSQDEIAAFANGNVIFNCWPYFREIVQNATIRLGVPIPPVPFLRVQVTRQPTPEQQPSSSSKKPK